VFADSLPDRPRHGTKILAPNQEPEMTETAQMRLGALSGTRNHADLPHTCSCGARWSGTNTCHCGNTGCHRTFTGLSAFDRHRSGGTCNDPAALGMAIAPGRAYEAWTTTVDRDTKERA
jgi:hypothetical protein